MNRRGFFGLLLVALGWKPARKLVASRAGDTALLLREWERHYLDPAIETLANRIDCELVRGYGRDLQFHPVALSLVTPPVKKIGNTITVSPRFCERKAA